MAGSKVISQSFPPNYPPSTVQNEEKCTDEEREMRGKKFKLRFQLKNLESSGREGKENNHISFSN